MVAWLIAEAGVSLGFMLGDYVYHRLHDRPDIKTGDARLLDIPHIEDGSPFGMIYGRCRVRRPVLVWNSAPQYNAPYYEMDQFYVLGLVMNDGNSQCTLHAMYVGDRKYESTDWTDSGPMTGVMSCGS